jgi:hypothetical protein
MFHNQPDVRDVWQLSDGDGFLITTRVLDLPPWFRLHPSEASGLLGYEMLQAKRGHQLEEPIDGPHIWRALTGDRIAWVGRPRSAPNPSQALRRIFDFRENALIVAFFESHPNLFNWGVIEETSEGLAIGKEAFHAVTRLGLPRAVAADEQWSLG